MSSLTSAVAPARTARPPVRLSHLGDELLARQAARGSERAFAALYERYHQQLYRYCRSILHDDADAQDALQSTFAGALQALRRDGRSAPLRPWLYRIAHNEAISLLRRRRRNETDELDAETLRASSSVEQEAADRARWVRLVADLGRLPERQRGALLLRELSGLSHDEIAVALGISTGGAKQAIFEARQALTSLEEGRSMSCEEARRRISAGDRRVLRGRRVSAHLRACSGCEAFALAIPARREDLRAMTPALPPAIAAAVLTRSVHASSAQGGAAGAASAGAGAAGKAVGVAMAWKTIAGVAVIAAAAAGVSGLRHSPRPHQTPASTPTTGAAQLTPSAAAHAASRVGADPARRSVHRSAAAGPAGPMRRQATAHPGAAGAVSSPQAEPRPVNAATLASEQLRPATGNGHPAHAGSGPADAGRHLGQPPGSVASTASATVKTVGSVVKSVTSSAVNTVSSVVNSATSTAVNATTQVANTVTSAVPVTAPVVNTVTGVVKTIVPPVLTGTGSRPPGLH